MQSIRSFWAIVFVALITAGCGGSDSSDSSSGYSVGGTVNGLKTGSRLTLLGTASGQSSWTQTTIADNGPFTLGISVPRNGSYAVTVGGQPDSQTCTVGNNSGAGVVSNVMTVSVVCSDNPFKVGGTVIGLKPGNSLTLVNNTSDLTEVTAEGLFEFASAIARGSSYAVTVLKQPKDQICSVSAGNGTNVSGNVKSVAVTCSDRSFKIGGSVVGLKSGTQIILFNNKGDPVQLNASGSFEFKTPVAFGGDYEVSIDPQIVGHTCTVQNGKGSKLDADVSSVAVVCSNADFAIAGAVVGLTKGQTLTISNNDSDELTVSSAGPFAFKNRVPILGSYSVAVGTQPTGQICSAKNPFRFSIRNDVNDIEIVCSDIAFQVSGLVSGLKQGNRVSISNNAGTPTEVLTNGPFKTETLVALDGTYEVSVVGQPNGQTCSIQDATGEGVVSNVTSVKVICSDRTSELQVNLVGLAEGEIVTLLNSDRGPNSERDALTLSKDGRYKFADKLAFGVTYLVTVGAEPLSQTCTVKNSSATVTESVSNVTVLCDNKTFKVSGTVSGLKVGQQVTLVNNGGNPTKIKQDKASQDKLFTFSTPVAFNAPYQVEVRTQPATQRCTINNDRAANVTANVASVEVICTDAFRIEGKIEGLGASQQVTLVNTLANNVTDEIVLGTNGAFQFPQLVAKNSSYRISVKTQPNFQTCFIENSAGVNLTAAVSTVNIKCVNGTGLTGLGGAGL